MYFSLTPGQLPAIAAQLSTGTAALAATTGTTAAGCVPLPPGCDSVSEKITEAFFGFATDLYDKTVQGVNHRIMAEPHLPEVDACYCAADAAGDSHISARGVAFGE
ncbi:PE domain-containing protein [Nocardia implantans]|uniref:PE domain-containing protein n=1 Tax=Nocardia implantans TaxID=3108168 RepID=A0ABU6APQ5_9NOCA|nr:MULTISPECIES: PE domain-containing protein [unclassified Nocardia]MBF6189796.1 PE domain-containing protein [Nocardia beijingensis]MEA3526973.1 PE domain-containing protein [Nocardia sp. CDC192]MEB3509449.1 PE domain-containing protein [Nocardia sp. CDC186]